MQSAELEIYMPVSTLINVSDLFRKISYSLPLSETGVSKMM